MENLEKQVRDLLSRMLARDAGKCIWWRDSGLNRDPLHTYRTYHITPGSNTASPGLQLLSTISKIAAGTLEPRFLKLYGPPRMGPLDLLGVRRMCSQTLISSLCTTLLPRMTSHSEIQDTEQGDRGLSNEPGDLSFFDSEAEASGSDDNEQEDDAITLSDQEEVAAAIEEELESLASQQNAEASIDSSVSGSHNLHFSEDKIQERVEELSKQYGRSGYQITKDDLERINFKARRIESIELRPGVLYCYCLL